MGRNVAAHKSRATSQRPRRGQARHDDTPEQSQRQEKAQVRHRDQPHEVAAHPVKMIGIERLLAEHDRAHLEAGPRPARTRPTGATAVGISRGASSSWFEGIWRKWLFGRTPSRSIPWEQYYQLMPESSQSGPSVRTAVPNQADLGRPAESFRAEGGGHTAGRRAEGERGRTEETLQDGGRRAEGGGRRKKQRTTDHGPRMGCPTRVSDLRVGCPTRVSDLRVGCPTRVSDLRVMSDKSVGPTGGMSDKSVGPTDMTQMCRRGGERARRVQGICAACDELAHQPKIGC